MSILGEYLQRVKAERDEAARLLSELAAYTDPGVYQEPAASECCAVLDRVEAFLSRYDLPDDYDEA